MAQFEFANVTQFNAVSAGTGNFVVASAVAGYKTPAQAFAKDGKVYNYFAQNADGTLWEQGSGAYTAGSTTLARTTIVRNSLGTTAKIVFAVPPTVHVFPSPLPKLETGEFETGTRMTFQQTSAPSGWTKDTTHNDKTLRVVSGTASSGGTNSFSATFASRTTDGHTLTLAQIASHNHGADGNITHFLGRHPSPGFGNYYGAGAGSDGQLTGATASNGGGGSHTHTYDMRVQYVDLIIASRDAA